ncbi:adenylate/guanylate cyclase domain-containing protein [Pimelobacter simplex]|uniref:adenylate/guanylate cyclase domain-containing protein n=1 Tax=Nocardioides simplex TaxID=2045 RepID=UPI001932B5C3|nr:adenylate/guanylate cyclase domain-containing protein [Pimelobacter simplex]
MDSAPFDPAVEGEEIAERAQKAAGEAVDAHGQVLTVGFFDLVGSTGGKLTRGNTVGIREALAFTNVVGRVVDRLGGSLVKTMGDGAMVAFEDPVAACRAAMAVRFITHEHLGYRCSAGLTIGRPRRLTSGDGDEFDLLGDVVDRAARVQSLALPGQVLIDGPLHMTVRGEVAGDAGWVIDAQPRKAFAKGVGALDLFEIAMGARWNLRDQLATPFSVNPEGRPTVSEKIALLRNAQSEIIEIGIGLTSFAQYFEGQNPGEFRDPIRALVRGGVILKCFAMDPAYEPGQAWLAEQDNVHYPTEAALAKERILREAKFQRENHYRGSTEYYTYKRVPEFWCLGVDVEDAVDGRMYFASYMMGIPRAATPVIQVSRTSNPDMYEHFLTSIRAVREASTET